MIKIDAGLLMNFNKLEIALKQALKSDETL